MRRASLVSIALLASACQAARPARPTPQPIPQPPPALVIPPIASAAEPAAARGEVDVALLDPLGGYWPGVLVPSPPSTTVQPCMANEARAGYAIFALRGLDANEDAHEAPLLVEHRGLRPATLGCLADALTKLRLAEAGLTTPSLLAYVSIR